MRSPHLAAFVLCGVACSGAIEDAKPAGPPAPPPASGPSDPRAAAPPGPPVTGRAAQSPPVNPLAPPCTPSPPARVPLRRLTRFEYTNTVRDLFGASPMPTLRTEIPDDPRLDGFDTAALSLTVSPALARAYAAAATELGAWAGTRVATLLPCDPQKVDPACGHAFVTRFGKRAFRRPLDATEEGRFVGLFEQVRAEEGPRAAVEAVVEALLASPRFLYKLELPPPGTAAGPRRLDPYEIAARLSYFATGSLPDDELMAAADGGGLATAAQVSAQGKRLLATPAAAAVVARFHAGWLALDEVDGAAKNTTVFPAATPAALRALRGETEAFVADTYRGGTLATLYGASHSFMNAFVAKLYGEGQAAKGDAFEKVVVDGTRRAGVLTHASLLAATAKPEETSPVLRGRFLRMRVLCGAVPPPPPEVSTELPAVKPGQTTRERFEAHSTNPACAGCHRLLDPVGFLFEHYDAIGRWRVDEDGRAVDARAAVVGAGVDDARVFDGAVAFGRALGDSDVARACYVGQWFRYGMGRAPAASDACALAAMERSFAAAGHELAAVAVSLVATDPFVGTTEGSGGGTP